MLHSKQCETILSELKSRCDHPTAEQIYLSLKPNYSNLSLATVYRNLNKLAKNNIILRLVVDETDRYDAITDLHYHFLCNNCKSLIDLKLDEMGHLNSEVENKNSHKVDYHRLTFYGTCKDCLSCENL